MAAEKLRDLSQPIDVGLLDATVAAFYGTGSKEEVTYSCFFFFFSFVYIFSFRITCAKFHRVIEVHGVVWFSR